MRAASSQTVRLLLTQAGRCQFSAAALQAVVRNRLAAFGDPWPRACHGDLLLRFANATRKERIVWWRAVMAAA